MFCVEGTASAKAQMQEPAGQKGGQQCGGSSVSEAGRSQQGNREEQIVHPTHPPSCAQSLDFIQMTLYLKVGAGE